MPITLVVFVWSTRFHIWQRLATALFSCLYGNGRLRVYTEYIQEGLLTNGLGFSWQHTTDIDLNWKLKLTTNLLFIVPVRFI